MYLNENWSGNEYLQVVIRPATVYENRGDGYKDHPDNQTCWLAIDCGTDMLRLRITRKQLDSLYWKLGAAISDSQVADLTILPDQVEAHDG